MKMWKILYFVTVIGVFILVINGQEFDIEKMEKCPCANDVIGTFLKSVAKNAHEVYNGQKLILTLWQQRNDNCTAHVLDKSPKPGRIEICMAYHGSVHTEEQGEGQDVGVQNESDNDEYQQGRVDIGQQQGVDFGQQQEVYNGQQQAVDNGQQQEIYNGQQEEVYNGQQQAVGNGQQQAVDNGQQQAVDNGQQQAVDNGQQQEIYNGQQQAVDNGQQQEIYNGQQQEVYNGQQQAVDNGQQQEVYNGRQQEVYYGQQQGVDIGKQQEVDNGQQQAAEDAGLLQDKDIEQLLGSTDLEQQQQSMGQLQQAVDVGQEQANVDVAQKQSELSNGLGNGGEKKGYLAEFFFTVDVNTGKLTDSTSSMTGAKRRKREIMSFNAVIIKIQINFEQNPDASDIDARKDQIKYLLRKTLDDYWMKMTNCLLDVKP